MISESSKETVPEFYFTSFIILLTQLEISIFKNWMDVLLSIKQNKNVKNMSFVIFYTDIVSNIFFLGGGGGGVFFVTTITATVSTCCNTV